MSEIPLLQTLARGHALTLRAIPGTELHVVRGRVWLTRTGDACDHFLQAGQALRLDGARTVVEADGGEAAVLLRPAGLRPALRPAPRPSAAPGSRCRLAGG